MSEKKKVRNILRINKVRCILAMILCASLCVMIFFAISDQLLRDYDLIVNVTNGRMTYHTFAILSNIFMVIASAMCIPYTVDGLRYGKYRNTINKEVL